MSSVSISTLKTKPAEAIREAADYPVAIRNRNEVKAYLVGKELYEKLLSYVEDLVDRRVVEDTDFTKGKDFEKVARELEL